MTATLYDLANLSARIERHLEQHFDGRPEIRQVLALAEEAGEAVGAARRYLGMARRTGTLDALRGELADVVITAFVTANTFTIDLPAAIEDKVSEIFARGWKDPR